MAMWKFYIDAFQWFPESNYPGVLRSSEGLYYIRITDLGPAELKPGDWIIRKGKTVCLCPDEVFRREYHKASKIRAFCLDFGVFLGGIAFAFGAFSAYIEAAVALGDRTYTPDLKSSLTWGCLSGLLLLPKIIFGSK